MNDRTESSNEKGPGLFQPGSFAVGPESTPATGGAPSVPTPNPTGKKLIVQPKIPSEKANPPKSTKTRSSKRKWFSPTLLAAMVAALVLGLLGVAASSRGSSGAVGSGPTLLANLTEASPSSGPSSMEIVSFGEESAEGVAEGVVMTTPPNPDKPTKRAKGAPAVCGVVRVMPLGDSLTAYPESFRGPLFRALVAAGLNIDFVGSSKKSPDGGGDPDHQGHGGYRIGPDDMLDSEGILGNMANNVDTWVPAALPDVIVLNIGTNDLAGGGELAASAPKKLTDLIAQLRGLAPKALLVVGGLPPNGWVPQGNAAMRSVDTAIAAAAAADSANVIHVTVYDNMMKAGFDPSEGAGTSDKTHFTAAGGKAFAKALEPAVTEAVRQAQTRKTC